MVASKLSASTSGRIRLGAFGLGGFEQGLRYPARVSHRVGAGHSTGVDPPDEAVKLRRAVKPSTAMRRLETNLPIALDYGVVRRKRITPRNGRRGYIRERRKRMTFEAWLRWGFVLFYITFLEVVPPDSVNKGMHLSPQLPTLMF